MNAKADVFTLLKSLSKNEKRFFRLFASVSREQKNYLRLFSAMDKMMVYDEKKLKKHFSGEKLAHNLSFEKNYLHKQIMKALRVYHGESTLDLELRTLQTDINILLNRGLMTHAEKAAQRLKVLSEKNEKLLSMISAYNFLDAVYSHSQNSEAVFQNWMTILDHQEKVTRAHADIVALKKIHTRVVYQSKKHGINRLPEEERELNQLLKLPILSDKFSTPFHHGKSTQLLLKAFIYYRLGKLKDEARMRRSILKSYEERDPKQYHVNNYLSAISNYIQSCIDAAVSLNIKAELKKYTLFFNDPVPDVRVLSFSLFSRDSLKYFSASGNYHEGLKLKEDIEKGMIKYRDQMNRDHVSQIHYYLAWLNFLKTDYKETLKHLRLVLQDESAGETNYYQTSAKILQLMTYLEKKDFDLLGSQISSVKRSLEKRNKLFEFERTILAFFRQAATAEKATREDFVQLKKIFIAS